MSVIKNIKLEQDGFVLDVPGMEVLDRGITALVGPSGAGKSTLIRVLLGLEPLKGWSWILNGDEMSSLPVEKRNFGVVFQNFELFPHLSAEENILFPLRCRGRISEERMMKVRALMERLEIVHCSHRKPQNLSGGEKQRVALARALSFSPRFVFLDEPFSSLDDVTRMKSRKLVYEVLKELEIPALLVSHDNRDILDLSSKVHKLSRGRLE